MWQKSGTYHGQTPPTLLFFLFGQIISVSNKTVNGPIIAYVELAIRTCIARR